MKKSLLILFVLLANLGFSQEQESPDQLFNKAKIRYKMRDLDIALGFCEDALKMDSLHYETLLLKGTILYDKNEYENALFWVTKSINAYDRNPEAYFERGLIYFYQNEFKLASEDFIKASNISINNADYFYFRGLSLIEVGETYEACKAWKRAETLGIEEDIDALEEKHKCAEAIKPESSKMINKIKSKVNSEDSKE